MSKSLKIGFALSLLVMSISFGQQANNIELEEVVNFTEAIPEIKLNDHLYSFRDRDVLITKVLRSDFWNKIKFTISLEDFNSSKQYTFKNEGPTRVFINNNELTKRHVFKSFNSIRKLIQKITEVEIRNDIMTTSQLLSSKYKEPIPFKVIGANNEIIGEVILPAKQKSVEKPITYIYLTADLDKTTKLNNSFYIKKIIEQSRSIALDEVEVVKEVEKGGIVYSPVYINGQITFKKNDVITDLAVKSKYYKKMGLNEWGIDVNTDSWALALRGHFKGPISPDGLPILLGTNSILNQTGPLWVVDGTPLNEPPSSVRSLSPFIRGVKILKYGEAALYGARGASGVIELTTLTGINNVLNSKRSFNVKGKRNRELMTEYQKFENKFKLKIDILKIQKKYAYENDNIFRMDSFQNEIDKTLLKNYLFTANFAIRNKDREIAPYLAYAKIGDAKTSLLDTIASSLTPKIKKSKYGRKFLNLLESRKKYD
jgi:hypothetical protein